MAHGMGGSPLSYLLAVDTVQMGKSSRYHTVRVATVATGIAHSEILCRPEMLTGSRQGHKQATFPMLTLLVSLCAFAPHAPSSTGSMAFCHRSTAPSCSASMDRRAAIGSSIAALAAAQVALPAFADSTEDAMAAVSSEIDALPNTPIVHACSDLAFMRSMRRRSQLATR